MIRQTSLNRPSFYEPLDRKKGSAPTMKLSKWRTVLLAQEVEALEDFGYTPEKYGDREIDRDTVFEIIVKWNGGLASASEIKDVIRRVYEINL